jgi:16S rRNA pseudouridine516 synthase
MRLDKFIGKSTTLSKAQTVEALLNNQVSVNGVVVSKAAFQVHAKNQVLLDGTVLVLRPFRYLLMNKPANTICANVDQVYPSALHLLSKENEDIRQSSHSTAFLKEGADLHIAGRLDADTTGLILITDDGSWTFNITLPSNDCKKVYRVGLSKPLQAHLIKQFNQGIQLQGEAKLTLPATLVQLAEKEVLLTITEGKFHQVKRMFAAVGNRVIKLHREQIGDVTLDVELGKWRYLTPLEVASFV